jgi:CCR4-NOT transcriptional regulation complex NOT5 subunit
VKRLKAAWPRTKIVIRADSGFCRDRMLTWCDRNDVKYVIGLARNSRLLEHNAALMKTAEEEFSAAARSSGSLPPSTTPR